MPIQKSCEEFTNEMNNKRDLKAPKRCGIRLGLATLGGSVPYIQRLRSCPRLAEEISQMNAPERLLLCPDAGPQGLDSKGSSPYIRGRDVTVRLRCKPACHG